MSEDGLPPGPDGWFDAAPDPGNSGPEAWSEDLSPDEAAEVAKRLQDEFGGDP